MKTKHFIYSLIVVLPFINKASAQTYFQQEVNYTIHVKLDDVKNEFTADEKIEYINNSPTSLTYIYMHLWPNAYKDNNTALAKQLLEGGNKELYNAKEEDKGYIDQLDFKVNEQPVKWEYLKDSIDICKIILNEALKSGDKIIISTPFHVKIPSGKISRMGHIGQSYQITQWYPKPAVFDRTGWNQMPYLNQGEFYSEFGSFDVSITLPKNYILGATGDLVDGEKEIEWLENNVKATEAMTTFDKDDLAFPPSDQETKTLRFKQKNVHDFAWFCDKRYHVLKGEIVTPNSKNKVTTWAMFTNAEGNLWKNSIQYLNDAIYYYSLWNGDYPYAHCTAIDGTISAGGGMEYPNITVIGGSGNAFQLDVVITHEVGHNWFYGMLGSNERQHGWMDEGLNSFNENRYIETKYPDQKLLGNIADGPIGKVFDLARYRHKSQYELAYLFAASKNEDQAMSTSSKDFTQINYGGIVYSKTAIVMDYLMAYLGEAEMDKAMQNYFDEWHFKHPLPEDFKKSIEKSSGKNLDWLFKGLINSTEKLDYKLSFAHKNADGTWDVGVKNTGGINGPVFIQGVKDGKLIGEVIYDGFEGKQALSFPVSDIDYFNIDMREDMPEINRNNNKIRTSGIFRKIEPLKFQFLGSLDNKDKTQLFWTPVAGWNNYNKWMFGLAFYNNILPQKKFEFELMPLFSYSTNDFAGYGHLAYNIFPNNLLQRVTIAITGSHYTFSNDPSDINNDPLNLNFNKIAPELFIRLKKSEPRSPFNFDIRYRHITIIKDNYAANYAFRPTIYKRNNTLTSNFNDLTFSFSKEDAVNPFDLNFNFQQGEKMMKTALTAHYSINYKRKNKGFDIRFFAGTFIGTKAVDAGPYEFRLSGQIGSQDYLYDNVFLGRTETIGDGNILANQFTETDGGFKFYSPLGQSSEWIAAINLKSSLGNLKLPINLYADLGTADNNSLTSEKFLYNVGVCLSFRKNLFEIYFPILISQDFKNYKEANGLKYQETIRFTLNINLINPFNLIRNFEL